MKSIGAPAAIDDTIRLPRSLSRILIGRRAEFYRVSWTQLGAVALLGDPTFSARCGFESFIQ
jgi:hypothetical protein